jgi:hypothetical protein
MLLANLGGPTQDIVIGGLLIGAILAGNLIRAAEARGFPWPTRTSGEGVIQTEAAKPVSSVRS